MPGQDIFDRLAYRGKKLEYWGEWNGMKIGVVLRRPDDLDDDKFILSIVSPFFNVNREIIGTYVLDEMDKIYRFLKYKPGVEDEEAKMGQDRGAQVS